MITVTRRTMLLDANQNLKIEFIHDVSHTLHFVDFTLLNNQMPNDRLTLRFIFIIRQYTLFVIHDYTFKEIK